MFENNIIPQYFMLVFFSGEHNLVLNLVSVLKNINILYYLIIYIFILLLFLLFIY